MILQGKRYRYMLAFCLIVCALTGSVQRAMTKAPCAHRVSPPCRRKDPRRPTCLWRPAALFSNLWATGRVEMVECPVS
ncbi:hypothetical protein M885DRAFT_13179 [Pelagophyceae sp. CCMP2097]|nr:hypothetical protein M885DRAFT_13179 [Pelagophyceae sp. CCMP2097]